jgi:hypothetical protein
VIVGRLEVRGASGRFRRGRASGVSRAVAVGG